VAAVPSIGRAVRVEGGLAPEADLTRALYEQYANQIFRYCLHQLGSREEAEDAVQSTFLNAFRGIKRGVVPELESAWLFKIAHNVCLSRRRTSWRRGRIESPTDFDVVEELTPAPSRRSDELIGLQDVLEQLPENQRRAILLREWQGLSYREIAEELELSQAAVETLIFRARRALASGLEQPPTAKRRVVRGADLGNVLAGLKSLLLGGGAAVKVAATVAVVSATTVVAAAPIEQHRLHLRPVPKPAAPVTAPSGITSTQGAAVTSVTAPVVFAPARGAAVRTGVRRHVHATAPAVGQPASALAPQSPTLAAPQEAVPAAATAVEPAPATSQAPPASEPAAEPKKDAAPAQTSSAQTDSAQTGSPQTGSPQSGSTTGTSGSTGTTGTSGAPTTGAGSGTAGTTGTSGDSGQQTTSAGNGSSTSTPAVSQSGKTITVPPVIKIAPSTAAQYPTTQSSGSGSSSSGSGSSGSSGSSQGGVTTPVVATPPATTAPAPVVAPHGTTTQPAPVVSNPALSLSGGGTTIARNGEISVRGSGG
jgi:RNA polymerase sigma factor (sigma-70 family)